MADMKRNIMDESLKMLRKIFSVTNNPPKTHKVVNILGIKIKKRIKGTIERNFREYNRKIGKVDAEIVHIMANNVFTAAYYNMIKNQCDISKQLFICYRGNLSSLLLHENNIFVIFM